MFQIIIRLPLKFVFIDIKLHKNQNAIKDCDDCLQMDVANIKAMLRKGQALMNDDKNTEVGLFNNSQ